MKRKLTVGFILLLSIFLALSGCFSGETVDEPKDKDTPKDEGTTEEVEEDTGPKILKLNNNEEPGSLHPGIAQGTHDSWILEHAFEGLTKKTPEGEIVKGMAEDWTTSDDGLTWTFTLKEGIKWSNGDPVTAHDFEYAWKFALNPATASTYAYQLYYLEGGEEFNSAAEGADLQALEDKVGVKALDEKTLEVKLGQSTPYFLDLTSFYTYYPVNKKVQEANPDWYKEAESYVSNGAFKLTEWQHKESMKLEKNENYYDKENIKLDEVHFVIIDDENTAWQMYQSGELDLVYPLPQDVIGKLAEEKNPEFQNGPDLSVYYYNLNNEKKPFNNVKIRKALSMAIDRETIVEHVAQGGQQPAYSIVPPGIPDISGDFQGNTGNLFEANIEEAKKLLAEGLAEEGLDKFPDVTLTYNTSEGHKMIAEAVQEMWRKNLDISITLENVEFQVKLDREKAGDYQISRAGWVGDYVDPMTFVDLWVTDGPYNDANWSNSEYDKLINTAKTTMDQEVRMKAMHDAEKIMMDEMPVIPVYFYTKPFTVKPYVTGVYTPINRYPQFIYADINK
ncbi:peptide ABC transporter substrate-binding protein [Fredinandcohnia quinoae]|uniref:Peptide ABC transporter substrate-binding protein n=1 Tax=Fredinandcohnia quinoae TaxID=2918902 RepID=A0AAW5E470_9BACI|nr:peptide ABC transporter substrate-binding protein [Fredinandcohnia sp. SECRCQ15]MCH1624697.1 peptide ABC transporter substrate-binding protein [Fredinandcohnia sp. SECRCQ15]